MSTSITVLLPAYNAQAYVAESVTSILAQTHADFELLIIDDGSTDDTGKILQQLARQDNRIRLVQRENRGLIATLNEGLHLAAAPLVARMDADDRALPNRLTIQKRYMDEYPKLAVCGSAVRVLETGQVWYAPQGEALAPRSLFANPMFHPTVMARRDILLSVGGYRTDMPCAEDYELWTRLLEGGHRLDNLTDVLLEYRAHPQNFRPAYKARMRQTSELIYRSGLARLGITPSAAQLETHFFCAAPAPATSFEIARAQSWLALIECRNDIHHVFDNAALRFVTASIQAELTCFPFLRHPLRWVKRTAYRTLKSIFFRHAHYIPARFLGIVERMRSSLH
ncbi:glycosyl transferase [Desulfocurvibacter africanus PCS]|uniref:Glycosyl transferase n=1 Tax=Desulfocurvibacter africanus PCS TaxID=1262666 RepID=M5Q3G9_DESAF|nr:glycosyltransferase [Desulfocurvibacter africanus]EMG38428.1 glycosyl transferase [Desulfocurvibacter africanus PCS]